MIATNLHFYFNAARHRLSHLRFLLAFALVSSWITAEGLQNKQTGDSWASSDTSLRSALVELIKLFACLVVLIWRKRNTNLRFDSYTIIPLEDHGLRTTAVEVFSNDYSHYSPEADCDSRGPHNGWPSLHSNGTTSFKLNMWTVRSTVFVLVTAVLHALRIYVLSRSREIVDQPSLNLIIPAATLFSLFSLRIFFHRNFSTNHFHAIIIQLCGLFIGRAGLMSASTTLSYSILLASTLCSSTAFTSTDLLYKSHHHHSLLVINITLFAFGFSLHSIVHAFYRFFQTSAISLHSAFSITTLILPVAEAGRDLAALLIIFYSDAVTEGVIASFAAAMFILIGLESFTPVPVSALAGCLLVSYALYVYVSDQSTDEKIESTADQTTPGPRTIGAIAAFCVALIYIAFAIFREQGLPVHSAESFEDGCPRKPLPSVSYFEPRTFNTFDNVLLIVFFSHARYDANLDFYREVYSEFFPNIIFIGPGSREDAGFAHSYDVLVDSYHSEEDLSDPLFYKMAGRMAHHMLYTAMKEHGCYDGYLWAPFDTLLNIPRLQQFDQNYFWYHSPWGKYVPNPAQTGDDVNRHPPPAIISPDPFTNLSETWRGWQHDWWWGDPHVGVSVCMEAFSKVPLQMRNRLSSFTDGLTRLVGGSADTLYIPGRHRQSFMEVLGLFLETDCFLEIATPTTVHLVVPRYEPILFVDHWWIYMPPFNASFVRQKWAEGFEVDTFHTFHWGDVDADGVWRGNHGHVEDVRLLLEESANRQNVDFHVRSNRSRYLAF